MPLYEYACESCGHHLEARQKLSDAPLSLCPACQKEELVRLISASSFSLKGSGWYADGYTGGGASKSAPKKSGGSSASAAKKDSSAKADGSAKPSSSAAA